MEDNIVEDVQYKFELKKVISDELPFSNAHNAEIDVDPWYEEPMTGDDLNEDKPQEDNVDNDVSYSILYGKNSDEAKLIEENIDLYSDLIKLDEEHKKAKQLHEAEFENCKKEIKILKETDAKSKTRIEELTRENENLKQSLSSLYRTVKREIEFKDELLAEANRKVSRLESENMCLYDEMCPNCIKNITFKKDSNTFKRKRSESPESSYKKRDYKPGNSKSYETDSEKDRRKSEHEITKYKHGVYESEKDKRKTEKKLEHEVTKNRLGLDESENDRKNMVKKSEHEISKNERDLDLAINKEEENVAHKQASKNTNHHKGTQTSNQCIFCKTHKSSNAAGSSRDPNEINDMFFNLLPDSLKQSFYDYEKDQMISLIKLKESFIDQYLNSKPDIPSPILGSTPKSKDNRTDKEQLTSSKNPKNRQSSTTSTPTTSSEHKKSSESGRRSRRNEQNRDEAKKDYTPSHVAKIPKNCYNSRLDKNDLVSLFMYRKEKIPFTEKKKFGLNMNDKNIIQEKPL